MTSVHDANAKFSYDPRVWYVVLFPFELSELINRQGSRGREDNVGKSKRRVEGLQHRRPGVKDAVYDLSSIPSGCVNTRECNSKFNIITSHGIFPNPQTC